jgi:hypothetical protein
VCSCSHTTICVLYVYIYIYIYALVISVCVCVSSYYYVSFLFFPSFFELSLGITKLACMQVCPQATECVLCTTICVFSLFVFLGGWWRENDGAYEGRNGLSKQVSDWALKDSAINALLRRFWGATKALLSLYAGAITTLYGSSKALLRQGSSKALWRRYEEAPLRL